MVAGIGLVYLERVRGARHRTAPTPSTLLPLAHRPCELNGCSHLIEALMKAAKESGQSVRGSSAVEMTDHSACCRHRQATEYYYDEGVKQLYYFSNATHGAAPTETFVAVRTALISNAETSFWRLCSC